MENLMKLTIGLFAHVDAGKTTFAEQLLYKTGVTRSFGRVDHQNTVMDSHDIEKERGITIFMDQYSFDYKGHEICLVDTPGHIDFSPEMERAIKVIDVAIVIINGVDSVQGHTKTIWRLLKDYNKPVFIYVNKLDQAIADFDLTYKDIQKQLNMEQFIIGNETDFWSDDLIEAVVESDDDLLDSYLDGKVDTKKNLQQLKYLVKNRTLCLCYKGSALNGEGVLSLFDQIIRLMDTASDESDYEFSAYVYKISHDDKGNRVSHVKVLAGTTSVKSLIQINEDREKINYIRRYKGHKYQEFKSCEAGDMVGFVGLTATKAGMTIGQSYHMDSFDLMPAIEVEVVYDDSVNTSDLIGLLRQLTDEEPTLSAYYNKALDTVHIQVMGEIQLEVLKERLLTRYEVSVDFGSPKILYKETMAAGANGYGHFEPLKHYAEVHLYIEPTKRGAGILFEDACLDEYLQKGLRRLVKQHIYEMPHLGRLTGQALTDVKITLLNGRAHNKHTHGGDFREATKRAIRQAGEKVEMILLEPYYEFAIKCHVDLMGDMIYEIQQSSGNFMDPLIEGDSVLLSGRVPVAAFLSFPRKFSAMTSGKGSLSLKVSGYDLCHNTEQIVKEVSYDKDADPEYTSNSVFCSKGSGYTVKWDQVKSHMHTVK